MFIAREKELAELKHQFSGHERTAVLVYGKRRIGKSTLIREAAKGFDGVVINHLCAQSSFAGNLNLLCRSVCIALGMPVMQFTTIMDLFDFLKGQTRRVLLIIDEYQYFKESGKKNELDSYMQMIIDFLPEHVKLVLCGSYITVMRELLEEGNPLFGRFTGVLHLEEMDYYDAAKFFPDADIRRKIENTALFGGSPYVLSVIDGEKRPEGNIKKYILPETGILRIYIENIMLKEIQKAYDVRIFEVIGNGRKRYRDIKSALNLNDNGLLDKQLKNLAGMEAITKVAPINKKTDRKKQFYTIKDNLMRFYFTYLFGNESLIRLLGEDAFYEQYIQPSLEEFVSRRFEEIAVQYFSRQVRSGKLKDVYDIGSYWYDDPENKSNGEFDCVLKRREVYDFYECKFYKEPMTKKECEAEEKQIRNIQELQCGRVGFICSAGFDFEDETYDLISGDMLYIV